MINRTPSAQNAIIWSSLIQVSRVLHKKFAVSVLALANTKCKFSMGSLRVHLEGWIGVGNRASYYLKLTETTGQFVASNFSYLN